MLLDAGRALARVSGGLGLKPSPAVPAGPGELLIQVHCAGICRSDLHAATGRITTAHGRILGHEFAGTVTAVGVGVEDFAPGARVGVFPLIGCGDCPSCAAKQSWRCAAVEMLGFERDGAFATQVRVPARNAYPLPQALSFRQGAYAEPLCASMAVLKAPLAPGASGAILGGGRIAELTRRVLVAAGHQPTLHDPARDAFPAPRSLDYVVETYPDAATFTAALTALRPGGLLVIKSRAPTVLPLDLRAALHKEITFQAVAYGDFGEALRWLAEGFEVADLFGPSFDLEDYARAFALAEKDEAKKLFLLPSDGRPCVA